MNWYTILKYSQVFRQEPINDIGEAIENIYELEYKYSMIKNRPWKGQDFNRRRDNILNILENHLKLNINYVKKPLLKTIRTWLDKHAIMSSEKWTVERMKENEEYLDENDMEIEDAKQGLSVALYEFSSYYSLVEGGEQLTTNKEPDFDELLKIAIEKLFNLNNKNSIEKIKNIILEFKKEMLLNTDYSGDYETIEEYNEYGNSFDKKFTSFDELAYYIDDYIDTMKIEDVDSYDFSDFIDIYYGTDFFIGRLIYENAVVPLIYDIYSELVFPYWKGYWSSMNNSAKKDIRQTRKTIETIYRNLVSANSIPENLSAINLAINLMHQTGSILDYIDEYGEQGDISYEDLTNLSRGTNIPQWNEDLRKIGVDI